MKKANIMICCAIAVLALAVAAHAQDFSITGDQHMDVTTSYWIGNLWDFSSANILLGGNVSYIYANNSSSVGIAGGEVGRITAYTNSIVNISEGSIIGINDLFAVSAYDTSRIIISGGSIMGSAYALNAYGNSSVEMSDGSVTGVHGFFIRENSNATISGGEIMELTAHDTSRVFISGGEVGLLRASGKSHITLWGENFKLGDGLWMEGNNLIGTGILSGTWLDGASWTTEIYENTDTSTILLVPEPASLLILALGGMTLRYRRS